MYRFTHVLITVCIMVLASFSVQAETDENNATSEKSRIPSWIIGTLYSVFDEDKSNELYTRNYITYSLNKTVAVGPQVEAVLVGNSVGLVSFVVGPRINIGYSENNTLGILVGYDTKKAEDQTGLTGRLSFTRKW